MSNVTPEEWRPVVEYEGLYEVSSLGRVRSLPRTATLVDGRTRSLKGKVLRQFAKERAYLNVTLHGASGQSGYRVARLVARAFLGEPEPGWQVNHKDLDKTNDSVENLEWMTPAENTRHALDAGRVAGHGERHAFAKLTREKVREIRRMHPGTSAIGIAKHFGLHIRTIYKVLRRGTWWRVE